MPRFESNMASGNSTSYVADDGGVSGPITWDDATWILTSSFIIFTMQSGFGLLEAGAVAGKNEVNIMMKNVVDVVFGGITYWMFGYGFSFGEEKGSNAFTGVGSFFVDADGDDMGIIYSTFVFQLSFATTATTVVSGAMAERTKFSAYIIFSVFNTVVYCFPAHWVWGNNGFLRELGVVDFAGSGVVHLVGGASALVAAAYLKPRMGRFDKDRKSFAMNNPAGAIVGMFMLWWGWLAFNCGSTFGISGGKWKLAAKAAVTTLISSFAGGMVGILLSVIIYKKKYSVEYMINSILGALVAITASCAIVRPWESLIIGAIGAVVSLGGNKLVETCKVDDPVGAVGVHGTAGIWGLLAVGIFAAPDPQEQITQGRAGLIHGGGFYLLGVQCLCSVCEIAWSGLVTIFILFVIDRLVGLRMSREDEMLGADLTEHEVGSWPTESVHKDKCDNTNTVRRGSHIMIGDLTIPVSKLRDNLSRDNFKRDTFRKSKVATIDNDKSVRQNESNMETEVDNNNDNQNEVSLHL
ncbi:hypothetical protein SNE40_011941 [Patella caerulea]|uniref:Ammonium transporter n=2 Tax=Patella caerulea TaxID=87958 RepID=A0AAN8JKJ6_PATCE